MSISIKICPDAVLSGSIKLRPTIFLAGPIQGAPLWQTTAIDIISEEVHEKETVENQIEIAIASPRRQDNIKQTAKFDYEGQVNWESRHLQIASENGTILFWLAKEVEHDCSRAYAQTTRFELGEWTTKKKMDNSINIVVGIEPGFSGERYFRLRLKDSQIPIFDTLEETCEHALQMAIQPRTISTDYKDKWDTLRAWLEVDCANGAAHKSKRALFLMDELDQGLK
jgi:Nucleoside 2-deoxyribosyltransferase like